MELFHKMISGFLGIPERQISSTLHLLGEGATIPFISRYRKEATGGLDEVQIEQIKEQHDKLCDIAKRKETILGTITEQGKLTAELEKRINDTWNPTELEDIYLPYKPKRKTRAEVARQKGLEPLATILLLQREKNLSAKAASFVKGEVKDVEDALKGARDIIAEQVNEDERARNAVRNQFGRQAEITAKLVKGKEEEAAKPAVKKHGAVAGGENEAVTVEPAGRNKTSKFFDWGTNENHNWIKTEDLFITVVAFR